jgi:hypothetical protein
MYFYKAKSRRQKLARLRQKLARFQKFARRTGDDKLGRLFRSCSLYSIASLDNNCDNSSESMLSLFNSSESKYDNGRIHIESSSLLLFMLAFDKLSDNG